MMFPELLSPPLAVIPILVNAGAPALAAVGAGLLGSLALLLKPRELLRVWKRKPWIPGLLVLIGLLIWVGFTYAPAWFAPAPAGRPTAQAAASATGTDWTRVALRLIEMEARGQRPLAAPPTDSAPDAPAGASLTADQPTVFRVNFNRTGHGGGTAPRNLVERWRYREDFAMILSSPLVRGNAVFCAYAVLDPPGSYGSIFRLNAETGEIVWKREFRDEAGKEDFRGFFSSPALTADGKTLLIGQGLHPDTNVDLVCLDAETGQIRWLAPTPLHFESSPIIVGDLVILGAGAVEQPPDHKPKGDPQGVGHPGYVVAFDLATGKEVWRHNVNDPESSPAYADGVVFIGSGFNGKAVFALRTDPAAEERLVWKTDTPHPATGPITLAGDLVLVGCGNGDFVFAAPQPEGVVMALDRKTGEVVWKAMQPDSVLGPIAALDGVAYAPVRNGEVVALNLADGSEAWRTRLSPRAILSGPAIADGLLYVTSQDGYLYVLDKKTGQQLERHFLNNPDRPGELGLTMSSPVVHNGRVYVGSETGGLIAFDGTP